LYRRTRNCTTTQASTQLLRLNLPTLTKIINRALILQQQLRQITIKLCALVQMLAELLERAVRLHQQAHVLRSLNVRRTIISTFTAVHLLGHTLQVSSHSVLTVLLFLDLRVYRLQQLVERFCGDGLFVDEAVFC